MSGITWGDVIGQGQLCGNLQSAIKYNKISHAYLIQGENLSGKRMIADIFAKALQCTHQEGTKPCNECRDCKQAINGNHPDIIYVEHEKPNVISVENIRQQVNSDIAIKPYSGSHKIYIIDEAEKMNVQAQNALLKTLEEPPQYAVIILLATRVEAMLPTILSRCVVLNIKPVSDDIIKNYLMNKVQIPDYRASVCASFARGNVGRAIQLASNEEFDNMKSSALGTLKNIHNMDVSQMAAEIKRISEDKFDVDDYLDIIFIWFRDVLLYKSSKNKDLLIFKEDFMDISRMSKHYSYEKLESLINSIDKTRSRIKANVNFELTMELLFMEIKN
ncbi:MAG: DNA polymerase III subunit delta' [Lachnospiraceae bacterium]|nr:DNA polymerase III subunit delta' [Lachnospiraceae bacterium]